MLEGLGPLYFAYLTCTIALYITSEFYHSTKLLDLLATLDLRYLEWELNPFHGLFSLDTRTAFNYKLLPRKMLRAKDLASSPLVKFLWFCGRHLEGRC